MNLIFGQSEDNKRFWSEILAPKASSYYDYPFDTIDKNEFKLNALYHALIDNVGLSVKVNLN
jgi:hypothetical protein